MSALKSSDPRSGSDPAPVALDVDGLHVTLAGRPVDVVTEISFELRPGEILGLVGESGSGKTTVALALLGYAQPGLSIVGGSISICGENLLASSPSRLCALRGKVISYVPQDPSASLNPAMRIGSQLMDVLSEHDFGSGKAERGLRLREVMQEVGLPSDVAFLSRYPHELSGGQQQRVAIAMAFACRPRVVVLDEPTTGLDVTTQANVLKTVKQLAGSHRTAAVYVSHDLAVVADLAHRTAVMYAGRIVEQAQTADLISTPSHPYTRRLIEAVPDPRRRRQLVGIPGHVAPLGAQPPGCSFAPRCEFAEDACRAGRIEEHELGQGHTVRCRRWPVVRAAPRRAANGLARDHERERPDEVLRAEGVVAWYGKNEVLHGATLSICRGQCLALVGESGSGKTTLARAISGLHRQARGELRLDGEEVPWGLRHRSAGLLQAVQYIFQNPYGSLNPRKSVRQLLEQPLNEFGVDRGKQAVGELLEQVSLSPRYASRYPSQLSGGERQRIAIARALAASPTVLICDEITSALDVSVQASILALLGRLHAEASLTVLFVTHNVAVVRAVANAVIVLNNGVIVESGPTDEVLDHPKDPYTETLLRDTPAFG